MKKYDSIPMLLLLLLFISSCSEDTSNPTGNASEYTISGIITGINGVTVTISGDAAATWLVEESGETYTFTVPRNGTYTITPSKSGYVFTPSLITYKELSSNRTQNFEANLATYTISGVVTGADSVNVVLSGDATGSWIVNDGMTYSFTVPAFGDYRITSSKSGYDFITSTVVYNHLVENKEQNFEAKRLYTLSGTIHGAEAVTITLSGDTSASQVVDSDEEYSFTVMAGGTYTIIPTKSLRTFSPATITYENLSENKNQNFEDASVTYTISGSVSGSDNVWIYLTGDYEDSQVINNSGSYSFTVYEGGNYTVTPLKTGYNFAPLSQTFTNLNSNQTQNYSGSIIQYMISGTVSGADDVTVTLGGSATGSQTVNSGGSYSFIIDYGGTYTITPTKTGYMFSPENDTFSNVISDQTRHFATAREVAFAPIPGGTFQMGDVENVGSPSEKPVHTVTLTGFEMSIYEITNAQYALYLNMALATGDIEVASGDVYGKTGEWSGQRYLDIGNYVNSLNQSWITYNNEAFSVTPSYENWPVIAVTWYGAKAFANYYGFDLPTEAEWEYASRGGRQYKYGTDDGTISSTNTNYNQNVGHPVAVGSYPANPFGLYDMSGNVSEWCHDWYNKQYESYDATNPTGYYTGIFRILRGGNLFEEETSCRSAYRSYNYQKAIHFCYGFRVVRRQGGVIY